MKEKTLINQINKVAFCTRIQFYVKVRERDKERESDRDIFHLLKMQKKTQTSRADERATY